MRATIRFAMVATAAAMAVALGAGGAQASEFSNPTPIYTTLGGPPPGCPFPSGCPSGRAVPYPSTIGVSGLAGTVTDVRVTIRDLTYTRGGPSDVDLMVVSPDSRAVMLMSDACGDNSDAGANPITAPITITFDDRAGSDLPANAPCPSGAFRPLDDDGDADEFGLHMHPDDHSPEAPVQAPPTTVALSTFHGIDPNGNWSLYLVDDHPNDPDASAHAGDIAGGWTIDLATTASASPLPPVAPPPPEGPTATTATRSSVATAPTGATTTSTTAGTTTTTTTVDTSTTAVGEISTSEPPARPSDAEPSKSGRSTGVLLAAAAMTVGAAVVVGRLLRQRLQGA